MTSEDRDMRLPVESLSHDPATDVAWRATTARIEAQRRRRVAAGSIVAVGLVTGAIVLTVVLWSGSSSKDTVVVGGPADTVVAHDVKSIDECLSSQFASMAIDAVAQPEPSGVAMEAQHAIDSHDETLHVWMQVPSHSSDETQLWAGEADGQLRWLVEIRLGEQGWSPGEVRNCG